MPPTSQGLRLLSILQRPVSIPIHSRNATRSTIPRTSPKSKLPPSTNPLREAETKLRDIKPENLQDGSEAAKSSSHGLLQTFLHHPRYRFIRRLMLVSPALILGILHSPYEIMTANGQSMSPFLNPNSSDGLPTTDRILVQRWRAMPAESGRAASKAPASEDEHNTDFQRGQVVIFPTPHRPDKIAVKRIVAVPGDVVHPLPGYTGGDGPVVVPWNHLWVEGDAGSRSESMDSNWYGPISQNLVLGEVKAVLTSWLSWNWLNWHDHSWPARTKGRVEENAIMEAAVDPDAINYSTGWRNGSIALVLEHMKKQPEQVLYAFVNDPKVRQETRRLYNNALYVAQVATSEQEKGLATALLTEMEDVYGREALVFGIRIQRKPRDRGELPDAGNSKIGKDTIEDKSASEAEKWLKKQGWEVERNIDGSVKMQSSSSR